MMFLDNSADSSEKRQAALYGSSTLYALTKPSSGLITTSRKGRLVPRRSQVSPITLTTSSGMSCHRVSVSSEQSFSRLVYLRTWVGGPSFCDLLRQPHESSHKRRYTVNRTWCLGISPQPQSVRKMVNEFVSHGNGLVRSLAQQGFNTADRSWRILPYLPANDVHCLDIMDHDLRDEWIHSGI
jgi:hypothetical protein